MRWRARALSSLLTAGMAGVLVVAPMPAASAVPGAAAGRLAATDEPAVRLIGASAERGATIARRPKPAPAPTGTAMPTPRVSLPAALDRLPGYSPQVSCEPTDKPGSTAYAELLKTIYPKAVYGISRACTESGTSEHKDGRAIDFMISASDPAQKRIADDIVAWLTADNGTVARRLGVMYLIWNKKIWGSYDIAGGWKPYYGANPHTDHIHTSLTWDGAMRNTSWWTGVALPTWDEGPCTVYSGEPAAIYAGRRIDDCPAPVAPPRTTHRTMVYGASGADVSTAQRLLGIRQTGTFDQATWAEVKRWQGSKGVAVTGVLDQKTWSMIDPTSVR